MSIFEVPIQDPIYFVGRKSVTRRILQLIKNKQSVSVVGEKRIGKTSLLNIIAHKRVFSQYGLIENTHRFAYIDGHQLKNMSSPSESYAFIVKHLKLVFPQLTGQLPNKPIQSFYGLQKICREAIREGLVLVVILDHFDVLTKNPVLDRPFFDSLRSLTMKFGIVFLTASEKMLFELEQEAPHAKGSPFFNFFHQFELSPLRPGENLQQLQNIFGYYRINIPSEIPAIIVDKLGTNLGTHPDALQKIAHEAIDIYEKNHKVWDENCRNQLIESPFYE